MANCMYERYDIYEGTERLVREPFWPYIKTIFFTGLCVAAVIAAVLVFAVSHFYAVSKRKKAVTEISREIQDYMRQGGEKQDVFKKEHEEISVQMSEIKSIMQRHEQVLKEEAARKNDLITYLAHDLKTPLTSVLGYLGLLAEIPEMPAEQRSKYVNIALDKAQRLEKLINEFFEITRYNLQQVELEKENIDLSYMLVQMTDEFYPLLSEHGNTVNLQTEEGITIYGDPVKLARVFNNILKNAIAYSYRETAINVWTERAENEVRICFRNRGQTIPARKLDSIFEKFFRLDEARASNTGGAREYERMNRRRRRKRQQIKEISFLMAVLVLLYSGDCKGGWDARDRAVPYSGYAECVQSGRGERRDRCSRRRLNLPHNG